MGFSKLKTVLAGVTTLLATSLLFADAVVDKDFDNNQNEFEYYWYYYDDNAGVGDNDRPQIDESLEPSVIQEPFTEHERNGYDGNLASDTWMVKQYTFTTTEHLGKKCATMPFKMGEAWEADYCDPGEPCAMPFVGIGTMLIKEHEGIDLTGVTQMHFSAKSRVTDLTNVTVKIQTLEIDDFAFKPREELTGHEFGYYGKTITVPAGSWKEFTIDVPDDLALPGSWAEDIEFNIKKCTKLAWEIKGDDTRMVDTLDIADVYFTGDYEFVSPSTWIHTTTTKPSESIFASFEGQTPQESPLRTYWYAYNDVEIGGTSTVSEATASQNAETGRLRIKFADQTGFNNAGKGAALEYTLGQIIPRDTIQILGFVGIGVNLYDSLSSTYFNADSAGITDIYFEYMTDAGAKFVTLEVSDYNDVGDATDPTRKDSRGSGIVWYRNFPPTNGEWKQVQIPLDSLVTHSDWEGYVAIPLDKTRLAKIQWKVQGATGTNGYYAIDNVALPNADFGVGVNTPAAGMAKAASFKTAYSNGAVRVNWTGATRLANGTVRLVNTRGMVVSSTNIVSGNSFAAKISAANIAAGMYFVSLEGIDVNGKAVASRTVMNIVK